jgi:O-antigen ligase
MKRLSFGQIFSVYLGLFSFALLVLPKLVTVFIILLAVFVIYGHVRRELVWKFNHPGLFFMLLYITYVIGIFFSHELSNGLKYAEYKLALFVLPILLAQKTSFEFKFQWPVLGLISGCLAVAIIGFFNACHCYQEHQWLLYCFSSSYISPLHHPSYFSAYLIFSIACSWYGYKNRWSGFSCTTVSIYSLFAVILYFFCLSLAALLFLGLTLTVIAVWYLFKRINKLVASIVTIGLPLFLFGLLTVLPGIKEDVQVTTSSMQEYASNPKQFLKNRTENNEIPGNQKRLIMWTITTELLVEHPFGVGTGNVDEYLHKRLDAYGFKQLVEEDLNPHNQFLQTALEIGIIGLVILLLALSSSVYIGYKSRNYLLVFLVLNFSFNMLFESMLQRQSGIMFYTFWILLLLFVLQNKNYKQPILPLQDAETKPSI